MRRVSAALVVLVLAACATDGGDPSSESAATPSEATSVAPTSTPSAAPPERTAAVSPDASIAAAMTITGQLGGDDIEGGCVFVEADDGTRYEIIWPDGWTIDPAILELTDPDGEVVARGGDELIVHGDVSDGGSFCQIGPIFEAVGVETEE